MQLINVHSKIKSSQEKGYFFLFIVIWTAYPFLDLLRGAFLHIPELSSFSDYAAPVLVWLAIIAALPFVLKRLTVKDLAFFLIISVIYLIHYVVYEKNGAVLEEYAFLFLCIVVPHYFIGLFLDVPRYQSFILNVSRFIVLLLFWYVFFYGAGARAAETVSDSMTHAYALLPHLLFVLSNLLRKRNAIDIGIVIIGIFQIFSFGNRGSMMAIVFFLLMSVLQLPSSQLSKSWKVFIGAILGVTFFFLGQISLFFTDILSSLGMSTRLFDMFLAGTFLEDESRMEVYWKPLLHIIKEQSFFGNGIGGDRVASDLIYAHNIVLELWISFGIVIGSALFLIICLHIYRGFKKAKDAASKNMILVLVSSAFVPLFVSGTYLSAFSLFLLFGLCTRTVRLKQHSYTC